MRFFIPLFFLCSLLSYQTSYSNTKLEKYYTSSLENDPSSIEQNVSVIHGDYSRIETDITTSGPDVISLYRCYSSRSNVDQAPFGGWQFMPHCFLFIEKDKSKTYSTTEETFEYIHALIGSQNGGFHNFSGYISTQNSNQACELKAYPKNNPGLVNSAKGNLSSWTNLKSASLHFDQKKDAFELTFSSGIKRFYSKHPGLKFYLLDSETLPSSNKIFYEYDESHRLKQITLKNSSEDRAMSWIAIQYGNTINVFDWIKYEYGNTVSIETSDKTRLEYHFENDSSGKKLLSKVTSSFSPTISYKYKVQNDHILLTKEEMPNSLFIAIDYLDSLPHQVKAISYPYGSNNIATTHFSYVNNDGGGRTESIGPSDKKTVYQFNRDKQLVSIQEYLNGTPYRIQKKFWGKGQDEGNLVAQSIEDSQGNVFYHKSFQYDQRGNILEETEYGNLTGSSSNPIQLDGNGKSLTNQEHHTKKFAYETKGDFNIVKQIDEKGNGLYSFYRKGTNLLLKKIICEKKEVKKRSFYAYNDGILTKIIEDDGNDFELSKSYRCSERHITEISPKKSFPNAGAPEIIEEKYFDFSTSQECLKGKTVNHFDSKGQILAQDFFDANGQHQYTVQKQYDGQGRLIAETNPIRQTTQYTYDENGNIESLSFEGIRTEFAYDSQNLLISIQKTSSSGESFSKHFTYDVFGNKTSEIDEYGNETTYKYDELGRLVTTTHPPIKTDKGFQTPKHTFTYDLFDNPITITDASSKVINSSYMVRGDPIHIQYPDGTQEFYKYDPEGSLHRFSGRDGITYVYEYDYLGRIEHIEDYERGNDGKKDGYDRRYKKYNAFHLVSESENRSYNCTAKYTYDYLGKLISIDKSGRKTDIIYDSLGRVHATKHWKSDTDFTLRINEYDALDRIVEKRIENSNNTPLFKEQYTYTSQGQLFQVIGYPNNQKEILEESEYDVLDRVSKFKRGSQSVTSIDYDKLEGLGSDTQKLLKQIVTDPLGNTTESLYDAMHQLVKVAQKDAKGKTLRNQDYTIDLNGNKTLEKHLTRSPGKPDEAYDIVYKRSSSGLLESIIRGAGDATYTEQFQYSAYGDLIAKRLPGYADPLKYEYSKEVNLANIQFQSLDKKDTASLTYDKNDNITDLYQSGKCQIYRTFNHWNELKHDLIYNEPNNYSIDINYDDEGLIQKITLPDKSYIEYIYDGPFVQKVMRHSKNGKQLYSHTVRSRDLMGRPTEEVMIGHAGQKNQTYDSLGRKVRISTDFFTESVPDSGFDPAGNTLKKTSQLKNQIAIKEYRYDSLYQLTSEKNGKELITYAYDSLGNRVEENAQPYITNTLNQLTDAHGITFSYHEDGNASSRKDKDNTHSYSFDQLGNLRIIKIDENSNITSSYDLFGRRLKKQEQNKDKEKLYQYFYLNDYELGCLDKDGNVLELKVPLDPNHPHESSIISMELYEKTFAPIQDLQGNVICLVDPELREVQESYSYSAFGEEKIFDGEGAEVDESYLGNSWRYQGKRTDKETGLVYFGNRYYDPKIGRLISPDPLGEVDSPNLYLFCHNNPLLYVDPLGLNADLRDKEFQGYFYGEYEPYCFCETHRDCKRGGSIAGKWKGRLHGLIDVVYNMKQDWKNMFFTIGAHQLDLDFDERMMIIEHFEQKQEQQTLEFESWIQGLLKTDPNDSDYFYNRLYTNMGVESALLIGAGLGAVKGVVGFGKTIKTIQSIERGTSYFGSKRLPFKHTPFQNFRNKPKIINGRYFTGHALDQAQNRGFLPSVIENTIKKGRIFPTRAETIGYYDSVNNVRVIVNSNTGKVITVIPGAPK